MAFLKALVFLVVATPSGCSADVAAGTCTSRGCALDDAVWLQMLNKHRQMRPNGMPKRSAPDGSHNGSANVSPNGTGNFTPNRPNSTPSHNVTPNGTPNGSGNFTPPNGSGNFTPPNGSGNFTPPNGSGNFTPPGFPNIPEALREMILQFLADLDDEIKAKIQQVIEYAREQVPETATRCSAHADCATEQCIKYMTPNGSKKGQLDFWMEGCGKCSKGFSCNKVGDIPGKYCICGGPTKCDTYKPADCVSSTGNGYSCSLFPTWGATAAWGLYMKYGIDYCKANPEKCDALKAQMLEYLKAWAKEYMPDWFVDAIPDWVYEYTIQDVMDAMQGCNDCKNGVTCGGQFGIKKCMCGSDVVGVAKCKENLDCVKEAACQPGWGVGTTKCKKCDAGFSCGGKHHNNKCLCGSDANGVARCSDNNRHEECYGNLSCQTGSGVDAKPCSECSNGKTCGGKYGKDNGSRRRDDGSRRRASEGDEAYKCYCGSDTNGVARCEFHTDCIENAACQSGSNVGSTKCKKCDKGWSCGGASGGSGGNNKCKCGSDTNGAAKCGGKWGDCKGWMACDTGSGIGTKKCSQCSGKKCKDGRCKCK